MSQSSVLLPFIVCAPFVPFVIFDSFCPILCPISQYNNNGKKDEMVGPLQNQYEDDIIW